MRAANLRNRQSPPTPERANTMRATAQLPFEFFAPEAPSFDNFVVGDNGEAVALLAALAQPAPVRTPNNGAPSAYVVWGGPAVGKSHLLAALADALLKSGVCTMRLTPAAEFAEDPFVAVDVLCVDEADRLSSAQQGWLFTAFNHVVQAGGYVVVTARSAPGQWPMRDDIRSRLASGLALEVLPIPQDGLATAVSRYAESRGFDLSEEVLTYILRHTRRDMASLCQTLTGIDRMSLAQKRAISLPLLRAYLAQLAMAEIQ